MYPTALRPTFLAVVLGLLPACGLGEPAPPASSEGPRAETPSPAQAPTPTVPRTGPTALPAERLRAALSEATGHVRLINFWASWCAPCLEELPHLRDVGRRHPEVDVVLVNVDVPTVRQGRVPALIEAHGLQGAVSHWFLEDDNPAGALREAVDGWPDEIPVTLVIDAQGKRRALHSRALSPADLERAIASATD